MRRQAPVLAILLILLTAILAPAASVTRIKDITRVDGVQNNQLVGYGLVVGLDGTGDGSGAATAQMIANMLNQMDMRVTAAGIDPKNVAFVMVSAELPPYAREGTPIDVVVSSLNGAENLEGGTLLFAALRGTDNQIHAIARGTVLTGGFKVGTTQGDLVKTNHPTAGRVPNGGTVVGQEVVTDILQEGFLRLILQYPDAKTAMNIKDAINGALGTPAALAVNEGVVEVDVTKLMDFEFDNEVDLLAVLGDLEVATDIPARVVINSRTGTVVAGQNIRLDEVAIAHGSLTITVTSTTEVSQPSPLSASAETVVIPQQELTVEPGRGGLHLVEGATVEQLVEGLNLLHVTTRDLISIFQSLKEAGALHAELIIL
ncbi:MAG TPA: flagellar basal body P-ring protein FlgI [bacterium]|nr:flagellar basal body P-ring protein FlgI [bacterium]HQL62114.1 flagellar basal body P-ring protein FlgI [bacterium]